MKILKIIYYFLLATLVLIALALVFSAIPIAGNYRIMVVLGGSMEPTIKMGSIVLVKPVKNYKIGDIITFGEPSSVNPPTTHRIVDIEVVSGKERYITQGDANKSIDPYSVAKSEVIGKTFFSIPFFGYVVKQVRTKLGLLLIIIAPALAIIIEEGLKVIKEIKTGKQAK